jgi:Na+-transporting methylmalonyl-CoA/oxaloacetate decarboxylase gamma subunit
MLLEIQFDLSNISGANITIAIVGYVIVFVALVLLFFVYNMIPKLINIKVRRQLRKEGKCEDCGDLHIEGDVNAAISMALYLYMNEIHDEESDVITIRRISKQYTPWSSKIYSTNTYFRMSKK